MPAKTNQPDPRIGNWKMCPTCKIIYDEGGMDLCDVDPFQETDLGEFANGCDECWELNATPAEKEEELKRRNSF